jgi:hypothetical protein
MIIRIFKSNHPALPLAIPVICGLLWLPAFLGMTHTLHVPTVSMPLFHLLSFLLQGIPYQLQAAFGCAFLCAQALFLNHIVNTKEVLHKRSFLPALFYAIFMSFLPGFLSVNPGLMAAGFVLLAFSQLLALYKSNSPLHIAFNAGFFFGIASLFYLAPIIDFFLLWIALLLLLPFSWRGFIAGLIGLAIPFFFASVFYFWIDQLPIFINELLWNNVSSRLEINFNFMPSNWIGIGFLGFLFVISLWTLQNGFFKNVIRTRNFQQLILTLLGLGFLSAFIAGKMEIFHLSLFALPLSVIISYYFLVLKKNFWAESFFWMLIISLACNFVFPGLKG